MVYLFFKLEPEKREKERYREKGERVVLFVEYSSILAGVYVEDE